MTEIPRLNGPQLQFPWPTATVISVRNIYWLVEVNLRVVCWLLAVACRLYLLYFLPSSALGMSVTSDVFRDLKYSFWSTNDVHNADTIFIIKHHQLQCPLYCRVSLFVKRRVDMLVGIFTSFQNTHAFVCVCVF